jgi:Ser/Thr protein kinase RdoA (MazF antagonist)
MSSIGAADADTDLQPLFPDPILEQYPFPPAYSDHTNHVWRVRTATEDVVVRLPRQTGDLDSPFWFGCHHLFGLDPRRPAAVAPVNALLAQLSPLPVPRVLRTAPLAGRSCLIVERLPGSRLENLNDLPLAAIETLGAAIARIHAHRFPHWGPPTGATQHPLATFHSRLADTLRALVARFFHHDAPLASALDRMSALAAHLPPPADAALVMIDVDSTQFLTDGTRLTGLVDTDAYAIAPRALDLIGYEYELDRPRAAAFAHGYRAILPLPDLRPVRPLYRYLHRLLETQGTVPLPIWLGWPHHFTKYEVRS